MRKYFDIFVPDSILLPIQKGHPWCFSKKFESFLKNCPYHSLVRIYTKNKKFVALGFYTPKELSLLKIFWYKENFYLKEFYSLLKSIIQKREPLFSITNSLRLVHGENDGIPSITVDLHNTTLVVRVYSPSLIYFGRYVEVLIRTILKKYYNIHIQSVLLQIPNRSSQFANNLKAIRVWYGKLPKKIQIHQNGIFYTIHPEDQKGGIYNDIRNLRTFILKNSNLFLKENALNLFANNGFLSKILESIGIKEIYSLEDSQKSIAVAKENLNPKTHKIIKLNIFKDLEKFLNELNIKFGTIIVDPPSLTASSKDKPKARKIYSELIRIVLQYLQENGILILCSCSNRIHENDFERIANEEFKKNPISMKLITKLSPEIDHPTKKNFPEGNYFKVHVYRRKTL